MKQRESVYSAVMSIMGEGHDRYEPTKEQRDEIVGMVTTSIANGETDFSDSAKSKYDTEEKITSYVRGLVSNWLRKDKRLNGGTAYVPKNPGSRTGMGDAEIKALRQLLKIKTDPTEQELINERLEARKQEIAVEKVKNVDIDISALPAHLVEELGLLGE